MPQIKLTFHRKPVSIRSVLKSPHGWRKGFGAATSNGSNRQKMLNLRNKKGGKPGGAGGQITSLKTTRI